MRLRVAYDVAVLLLFLFGWAASCAADSPSETLLFEDAAGDVEWQAGYPGQRRGSVDYISAWGKVESNGTLYLAIQVATTVPDNQRTTEHEICDLEARGTIDGEDVGSLDATVFFTWGDPTGENGRRTEVYWNSAERSGFADPINHSVVVEAGELGRYSFWLEQRFLAKNLDSLQDFEGTCQHQTSRSQIVAWAYDDAGAENTPVLTLGGPGPSPSAEPDESNLTSADREPTDGPPANNPAVPAGSAIIAVVSVLAALVLFQVGGATRR